MKRTKEELEKAAKKSFSIAGMCKYFGIKPCGGNYKTLNFEIKEYNIDISHFTGQGWNVGLTFRPMKVCKLTDILIEDSSYRNSSKLKLKLFKENIKEKKCEKCHNTEWFGSEIPLELHHINGINTDNRIENLQILCPNCHAQTETYRGKNSIK